MNPQKSANDSLSALLMPQLWTFMAWQDIKARYRGSLIGPFWVAGGLLALGLGAGSLYAVIFRTNPRTYIPYLTISIGIWTYLAQTLIEACTSLLSASTMIKNSTLPVSLQIYRTVYRNLIVLGHNALVVLAVLVVFQYPIGWQAPLSIVGLALLTANLVWMSWLLAYFSARYRDVPQIVTYAMGFIIFLTPVFWSASQITGGNSEAHKTAIALLSINPLWHLLEVVRAPIIGTPIRPINWIVAITMALIGNIVAIGFQRSLRKTIVFWV